MNPPPDRAGRRRLQALAGATVRGNDGKTVGRVRDVYLHDATGDLAAITVMPRQLSDHSVLIPAAAIAALPELPEHPEADAAAGGPGRAPARRHPDRAVGRPPPAHPARHGACPAGGDRGAAPRGGIRPRMGLLLLTHYYAREFGAPQRRWSALIGRFIAAGHRVAVAAPVPHYAAGRPTRTQRRSHRVGA